MAFIRSIVAKEPSRSIKLHPTETTVHWCSDEIDGRHIFQFSSTGSDGRQNPGKESQTFQLDARGAKELWQILGREFNFD